MTTSPITSEQSRTLTFLRRSRRWSQEGEDAEWITLKGLCLGKPTQELFLKRILLDLLTLGLVTRDDNHRILDTPFGSQRLVSVSYWSVKEE